MTDAADTLDDEFPESYVCLMREHILAGLALVNTPDEPTVYVLSFGGTDHNDPKNTDPQVAHIFLNGTQLARLMEEMGGAAIAEMRYALTRERTHVQADGTVTNDLS